MQFNCEATVIATRTHSWRTTFSHNPFPSPHRIKGQPAQAEPLACQEHAGARGTPVADGRRRLRLALPVPGGGTRRPQRQGFCRCALLWRVHLCAAICFAAAKARAMIGSLTAWWGIFVALNGKCPLITSSTSTAWCSMAKRKTSWRTRTSTADIEVCEVGRCSPRARLDSTAPRPPVCVAWRPRVPRRTDPTLTSCPPRARQTLSKGCLISSSTTLGSITRGSSRWLYHTREAARSTRTCLRP